MPGFGRPYLPVPFRVFEIKQEAAGAVPESTSSINRKSGSLDGEDSLDSAEEAWQAVSCRRSKVWRLLTGRAWPGSCAQDALRLNAGAISR